jgi:hypothetical protein
MHSDLIYSYVIPQYVSRLSYVSIVTRLKDRESWFDYRQGQIFFSSPPPQDWLWDPPSILFSGLQRTLSPVLKRLPREADHLLPSSVEIRIERSYISTTPWS